MKMDKNTMFMIGASVLGFVAVRFYLKNRNKNEESSNAIGRSYSARRRRGNITAKARMQTFVCTDEDGNTTTLETNNYNEYSSFANECINNGGSITQGTGGGGTIRRNARISRNKYSQATGTGCGCGA